jgi:hypothetical protein
MFTPVSRPVCLCGCLALVHQQLLTRLLLPFSHPARPAPCAPLATMGTTESCSHVFFCVSRIPTCALHAPGHHGHNGKLLTRLLLRFSHPARSAPCTPLATTGTTESCSHVYFCVSRIPPALRLARPWPPWAQRKAAHTSPSAFLASRPASCTPLTTMGTTESSSAQRRHQPIDLWSERNCHADVFRARVCCSLSWLRRSLRTNSSSTSRSGSTSSASRSGRRRSSNC